MHLLLHAVVKAVCVTAETSWEGKSRLSWAWLPAAGSFEGTALRVAVCFGPAADNSCTRYQLSARLSAHLYIISLFWRRGNSGPESPCCLPKVVPWEMKSSIPCAGRVPVLASLAVLGRDPL